MSSYTGERVAFQAAAPAAVAPAAVDTGYSLPAGSWSTEWAYPLGEPGEESLFEGKAMLLDRARWSSVANAIDALNAGTLVVEAGYCVIFSNSRGLYYLLWRQDKDNEAWKALGLDNSWQTSQCCSVAATVTEEKLASRVPLNQQPLLGAQAPPPAESKTALEALDAIAGSEAFASVEQWLNTDPWLSWFFGTDKNQNQEATQVVKALALGKNAKYRFWAQSMVAGPSVKRAFLLNLWTWSCFFTFPFLAYFFFLECAEGGGMARYPKWCTLILGMPLIPTLYWELQTLQDLLPAQLFILANYKHRRPGGDFRPRMQCLPLTLRMFFCWNMFSSVLGHLDLVTNSLFVARAWKTHSIACKPDTVTEVLHAVLAKSKWPFNELGGLHIGWLVLFAWLAMLPQVGEALACSVPLDLMGQFLAQFGLPSWLTSWVGDKEPTKTYNFAMNDRTKQENKFFLTYATFPNLKAHHQDALFALCDSGRMKSVKFLSWTCTSVSLQKQEDSYGKKAGTLYNYMQSSVKRFSIYVILESLVFMQLQATSIGLSRCLSDDNEVDGFLVFSVGVSLMSSGLSFIQCTADVLGQYKAIAIAAAEDPLADKVYGGDSSTQYNQYAKNFGRNKWLAYYLVAAAVFSGTWLYALMKLVMLSTSCTCGWNFKMDFSAGCVLKNDVFTK